MWVLKFVILFASAHGSCFGCTRGSAIEPMDFCSATNHEARKIGERMWERDFRLENWAPNVFNKISENTEFGWWLIREKIAATQTSVIFTISQVGKKKPEFVAKYLHDCQSRMFPGPAEKQPEAPRKTRWRSFRLFHPSVAKYTSSDFGTLDDQLIREFAISRALRGSGIVTEVVWLSGSTSWTAFGGRNPKLAFDLEPDSAEQCIELRTQIRFIIQERVGVSVARYMRYRQENYLGDDAAYLREVFSIARKSLALLQRLHERGVIHGDVHGGNIAFRSIEAVPEELESCENEEFVLIDLGLAALVCGDQKRRATPAFAAFHLLSPWQLRGAGLRGFRDDVFRLFELLADLIGFGHYHQQLSAFVEENLSVPERVFFIKENLRLFGRNDPLFVGNSIIAFNAFGSYAGFDHVQDLLESCMRHVLSLATPGSPVDYEFLDSALLEAANLLSTSSSFVESLVPDLLGYA